jgi:hypothetical protein
MPEKRLNFFTSTKGVRSVTFEFEDRNFWKNFDYAKKTLHLQSKRRNFRPPDQFNDDNLYIKKEERKRFVNDNNHEFRAPE